MACQLQAHWSLCFFLMQELGFCKPHSSFTSRFSVGFHQQGTLEGDRKTGGRGTLEGDRKTGGREIQLAFSHMLAFAGDCLQSPVFFLLPQYSQNRLHYVFSKTTELARLQLLLTGQNPNST